VKKERKGAAGEGKYVFSWQKQLMKYLMKKIPAPESAGEV